MSSGRASGAPAGPRPHRGRVLGTAGHIDHGKTTLVRALTGVDCDRLPEEKTRGITIDLGFASLDLGDDIGTLSVVDVPGHEGLVRTMVSGASGIDLLLLVVAADEGVMPQTREHVAICELLGLERGVVALTRCDLVDEEMREFAREDVRELLAPTALRDLPIIPCSGTTGEGLDALRAALGACTRDAPARTARAGPPRLGIDRVFAVRGFGTVVTGTLVGSSLRSGAQVEVHPVGVRARVRGLQSHGRAVDEAQPGMRTAVNLQGVDVDELSRGEVVAPPDALLATRCADVRLHWLATAPTCEGITSVEVLTGTARRRARLAPIGAAGFTPGQDHFARVHIDSDALPLLPGDRFVVRGFARNERYGGTVGGGVVLDAAPPRRRRSDPALLRELETLARGDACDAVRERIVRRGLRGCEHAQLVRETGLDAASVETLVHTLATAGVISVSGDGSLSVATAALERMQRMLLEALDAFHRRDPMRPGMPTGTLRAALPDGVPTAARELALARLVGAGLVVIEGELARRAGHRVELDAGTR